MEKTPEEIQKELDEVAYKRLLREAAADKFAQGSEKQDTYDDDYYLIEEDVF